MSHPERLFPQRERRVTDYLSASQNNDPLLYPGQRPETSYITDGETVYLINVETDEQTGYGNFLVQTKQGNRPADEILAEHGAAPIEERIPILAFGANLSPGSLENKFRKVGRPDAQVIPTMYAELKGKDVVWSGGPGIKGNFIAILYEGEETQDTAVQVGVNFLTPEQVIVMNATEMAYELSAVTVQIGDEHIKAFYYAGRDSVYLKNGHPVAVESIAAKNRTLEHSPTKELLEEVLAREDIMTGLLGLYPELQGVSSAEQYVAFCEELFQRSPADRMKLRRAIHTIIGTIGHSKYIEPSDAISSRQSWANPSTLPTLKDQRNGLSHHETYRLPSEELGEWKDKSARDRVLRTLTTHLLSGMTRRLELQEKLDLNNS